MTLSGKWLFASLLLINIVSCSQDDSKKTPLEDKKSPNYDTKSCDFSITEGDVMDPHLIGISNISKVYFDKEFNQNYLDGVASTSVKATIDFVNQTGVTVYKSSLIDTQLCSSSLFGDAQIMATDIQGKWNEAIKQIEGKEGFILGLYLPQNSSRETPTLNSKAAIIVRENTNRWTLIHEFMHHLFMKRSVEQGFNLEVHEKTFSQDANLLLTLLERKNLTNEEMALTVAEPYINLSKSFDDRLIHFTLEEMTIEAVLKDAISRNKIKYAPTNSNWYIHSSAKAALKVYNDYKDLGNLIYKELPQSKETLRTTISSILDKIRERIYEIEQIKRKYPYDESFDSSFLLADDQLHHEGCSHQAESERILKITSKLKFPNKAMKTFH